MEWNLAGSRESTIGSGRKMSGAQGPGSQGREETILEAQREKRRQGRMHREKGTPQRMGRETVR